MEMQTRIKWDGERAYVETDDPEVVAQLEELEEAERLDDATFSLPAAAARIHFPHVQAA